MLSFSHIKQRWISRLSALSAVGVGGTYEQAVPGLFTAGTSSRKIPDGIAGKKKRSAAKED